MGKLAAGLAVLRNTDLRCPRAVFQKRNTRYLDRVSGQFVIPGDGMETLSTTTPKRSFDVVKARTRFFGLTWDECIQAFFGGNAAVAVIVLALITIFLFREGIDFFSQNRRENLVVYRQAGLEYVDIVRQQEADHTALNRYLGDIRLRSLRYFMDEQKMSAAQANAQLAVFDEFAGRFSDAIDPIRAKVSEWGELASAIKTKFTVGEDEAVAKQQLIAAGKTAEAEKLKVANVEFETELQDILGDRPSYLEANREVANQLTELVVHLPKVPTPELGQRMQRFAQLTRDYVAGFPEVEKKLQEWDFRQPLPWYVPVTSFLFGKQWLTASFWQDWYGILPLLTGSIMVSIVALALAVPLGVGAAIYVNQVASAREQKIVKPAIEFISAFPSVVLGFFGIAVLGEALRALSQMPQFSWVPGFPIAERLNVLTAGCLLALLSVPTIFTLAEDALNNVPRSFKEASFALGASRLQTIAKIVVPASLSGIISAVLLGLGRVIGETMVVLLCAGNRIAIPDFSAGLAVFTQPVHTMTGIIAQEMGEVVRGSVHYRALFMVGVVLFFLSLTINYIAQAIVRRYRIAGG
jgi:phosphate transport system permease protein